MLLINVLSFQEVKVILLFHMKSHRRMKSANFSVKIHFIFQSIFFYFPEKKLKLLDQLLSFFTF